MSLYLESVLVEFCSGGANDCHGSSMSMMSGGASVFAVAGGSK